MLSGSTYLFASNGLFRQDYIILVYVVFHCSFLTKTTDRAICTFYVDLLWLLFDSRLWILIASTHHIKSIPTHTLCGQNKLLIDFFNFTIDGHEHKNNKKAVIFNKIFCSTFICTEYFILRQRNEEQHKSKKPRIHALIPLCVWIG